MWADIRTAFSFLTILPFGTPSRRQPGWSFSWYPLVGLSIGLCLALIAQFAPFAADIKAFCVVLTWIVLTGGLHLDGFGDSCDGLFASVTAERRLEIMRDPRAGNWAVTGLLLLLLGKWLFLQGIAPLWLIAPPVIGRWAMTLMVFMHPYARVSGLGSHFRAGLSWPQPAIATAILFTVMLLMPDWLIAISIVASGFAISLVISWWARGRLNGGLTGDVYGAICEVTELVCLTGLYLWYVV